MIRFKCKNCSNIIKTSEANAGKKGRCPKCKTVLIVPTIAASPQQLELDHSPVSQNIPKTPESPTYELKPQTYDPTEALPMDRSSYISQSPLRTPDDDQSPPRRPLPFFIDIFLYPMSTPGIINLAVFWILVPISLFIAFFLLRIFFVYGIPFLILPIITIGYAVHYLMECISDSAKGGIRAPDNINEMPEMSAAAADCGKLIFCFLILWAPTIIYYIYIIKQGDFDSFDRQTDVIYWLCYGYAIFFHPIALTALAMFRSTEAFNPFLWIISILRTFFQYTLLVILCICLAFTLNITAGYFEQNFILSFFSGAFSIYLAMVTAHLLGRFYYRNVEKLNWDV